jgi:pimeloyl-ACP methyl ester carboxylesterase
MSSETEIRSFRVDMPDEAIADLRQRIADTRWPTRELVADRSQGVQLATLAELARYWAAEYDWRACEARLNALTQTVGYALQASPVALAAWMLDHDTDSYDKISRAFLDGQPSGGLTRDHVLDNITLYWLTGTGASAARSYWENTQAAARAAGQPRPEVKLPVGFTTFPGEIWRTPRSWVEKSYPNVTYFNEVDRGGHFAAWEEPELFATEIRAAFKPLR